MREQKKEHRIQVLEKMATKRVPCVVISRNLAPTPEMIEVFERVGVPVFRTTLASKAFTTEVTVLLEERFRSENHCSWYTS